MASIFKKGRDRKKKYAPYYIEYYDHTGRRRSVKGSTDKRATELQAAELEKEVMLKKRGLIDPDLETALQQKQSPLPKAILEFEASLGRNANTPDHIKLTVGRVSQLVERCGFRIVGDISSDRASEALAAYRKEEDLGHRTFNHYAQAFEQFCAFLIATGRMPPNTTVRIPRMNCQTDVRTDAAPSLEAKPNSS